MKKLLALLFTAILTMSLFACGTEKPAQSEAQNTQAQTDAETSSAHASQKDRIPEEWQDRLWGNWSPFFGSDQVVTLSDDGTCKILGKDYTWRYDRGETFHVMENDTDKYTLIVRHEDSGFGTYMIIVDENGNEIFAGQGDRGLLRRTDGFTTIELTEDNFWDYFEIIETPYDNYNAFNELETVRRVQRLSLKEGYENPFMNPAVNEITIEMLFETGSITYYCDADTMTFVIPEENVKIKETDNSKMFTLGQGSGSDRYGIHMNSFSCSAKEFGNELLLSFYMQNPRFVRASGPMVILESLVKH